jgi:hypothetical protein
MGGKVAKDLRIAHLAGSQHGVVSRSQLAALGLTKREIDRRLAVARLQPLHRGVYAVGHRALTVEGRWMAAVLACGANAVLSHATAAAAWDLLPAGGGAIHVTVPGDPGRARRRGVRVHRSATIEPFDTTNHRGLPVTTPVRTVLDVAATLNGRRLEQTLDRADRLLDFAELQRRLEAHPTRPGAPSLRAVSSRYTVGSIATRSELEECFLRLCDDHGLPRPEVNSSFAADRERDVALKLAGWAVLRFAYEHVTGRARWVAAAIRGCRAS